MFLGVFVLQKGLVRASVPQAPAILSAHGSDPLPPQPQPSLADLIPGGLTEQHKSLLQSLMASQAVNTLAQVSLGGLPPQTSAVSISQAPPMPPFAPQFVPQQPMVSPPQPFTGSATPFPGQIHGIPGLTGYGGYQGGPDDRHRPPSSSSPSHPPPHGAGAGPMIHPSRLSK